MDKTMKKATQNFSVKHNVKKRKIDELPIFKWQLGSDPPRSDGQDWHQMKA